MEFGLGAIWLFSFIICVIVGAKKGNPIGSAFLGLLLGPIALIFVLLSADKNKKKCKKCSMLIPFDAKVCGYCRNEQ